MSVPSISVIVPLYNKLRWIQRALDSIAAQTLTNFEVIVVDDGSTDGSEKIVEAYPDPRFRLIRQPNAGPGSARNRGLLECRADLVAFLDADDEWLPEYLEVMTGELQRQGPEVVAISCSFLNGAGNISSADLWKKRGIFNGVCSTQPDTDPALLAHRLAFMHCCCTVARLSVIHRWGDFYSENKCLYAEDSFLWLKILLNETVAQRLAPLVRIHHEAGGLSQNLTGARPIEPFLEKPELIEQACPENLLPLLKKFLSLRAFKTACMLGYWGQWQAARALRQRFRSPGDTTLPYFRRSGLFSTPLGPSVASAWRALSRRSDPPQR